MGEQKPLRGPQESCFGKTFPLLFEPLCRVPITVLTAWVWRTPPQLDAPDDSVLCAEARGQGMARGSSMVFSANVTFLLCVQRLWQRSVPHPLCAAVPTIHFIAQNSW